MDDAEQEAREQTDRGFRIDARLANTRCVEIGHLRAQPAKIENPVDASEDMIVGDEVPQRSADKEFQLIWVRLPIMPPST